MSVCLGGGKKVPTQGSLVKGTDSQPMKMPRALPRVQVQQTAAPVTVLTALIGLIRQSLSFIHLYCSSLSATTQSPEIILRSAPSSEPVLGIFKLLIPPTPIPPIFPFSRCENHLPQVAYPTQRHDLADPNFDSFARQGVIPQAFFLHHYRAVPQVCHA